MLRFIVIIQNDLNKNKFRISDLRNEDNSVDYMKVLCAFADVLYSTQIIRQKMKTEALSTILTPSDEAFILLLIIVYFEENADTEYNYTYQNKKFVLRSGWQEAGIDLWNTLYIQVKEDRIKQGVHFDSKFCHYYDNNIRSKNESDGKRKKKVYLPPAMNDL